jgi:hypothetical protein
LRGGEGSSEREGARYGLERVVELEEETGATQAERTMVLLDEAVQGLA